MKFLIDTHRDTLAEKCQQFPELVLGQLLTPLTRYSCWDGLFAIDNGAFSGFRREDFQSLLAREEPNKQRCKFVCVPDIVGNGRRTLELWKHRHDWVRGWPLALVLQNGAEDLEIPWDELQAVFIGGIDPWKESAASADLIKTAKTLGKWVHIGRVNTSKRFKHFLELGADSCDGSGIARYDHMLVNIHRTMTQNPQPTLFDEGCSDDQ